MSAHPFHDVAIVGVHNTPQARRLEGHTSVSIALEAARGVLDASGIDVEEIDGLLGAHSGELAYTLGLGPLHRGDGGSGGIAAVLEAATLIAAGLCRTVLVATGGADVYVDRGATAPWTRPDSEFVSSFGLYTAVEFALIARRHMEMYGTRPEDLATVAATIRNNGHVNPQAVQYGRGPFTAEDVLASRPIAEPFHLLDCAITSEGGSAMLLTAADRAADLPAEPVYVLGGGKDSFGPSYRFPPSWDLGARGTDVVNGEVGRRAAREAFAMAGIGRDDVDVFELYDPFSFEIIRQLEAFELCGPGEGAELVRAGAIGPDGTHPVSTDGGLLSFSHAGSQVQLLQRVVRGVEQLRGACATRQVPDAQVALCSNGGAGALFTDVLLLGRDRP